jgi:hypothetical protein
LAKLGWALLFCVFATLLPACKGKKKDVLYIEPELQPFVSQFVQDAMKLGAHVEITNLSAQLSDRLEDPAVGECVRNGSNPMIRISRSFWQTASDANKQLEVYHELGHCVLNREHDDAMALDNGNIPRSIMNSSEIDIAVFLAHYDYYLCELFSSLTGASCSASG